MFIPLEYVQIDGVAMSVVSARDSVPLPHVTTREATPRSGLPSSRDVWSAQRGVFAKAKVMVVRAST